MLDLAELILAGVAAVLAGIVNALAGGGTLITFPTLMALGVPAVAANVTNTVALSPGYLGAALAQSEDLRGQRSRLWMLLPVGAIGGIAGGILLLNSSERIFRELIPYLILLSCGLLAVQDPLRSWILRRSEAGGSANRVRIASVMAVLPASVYGGYFGAAVSVIVLAVLGLVLEDSLTRLNALKQAVSFSINIATAIFFLFSGQVVWPAALVMAAGAVAGGALGGRLASKIKAGTLRWIVVANGVLIAIVYFVK